MVKREFLKMLCGILGLPVIALGVVERKELEDFEERDIGPLYPSEKYLDVNSFRGWLKTGDGRPIFVDNITNGGYNDHGYKNAQFLTGIRVGLVRVNCGEGEVKRLRDIMDACHLISKKGGGPSKLLSR